MDRLYSFKIEELNSYREGKRLEAKSAKGGLPNSLWETYSAFANSEGGVIVLGIKENEDGSFLIEGLKDAAKLEKDFWNLINNRQKVSTNILTDRLVKIERIEGKEIIVIRVPRADRTTLILSYGGNQPDIQAMKLLYDEPDGIIIKDTLYDPMDTYINISKGESTDQSPTKHRPSTDQAPTKYRPSTDQIIKVIMSMNDDFMTLNEIMVSMGLKHRPSFRKNYFVPSLDDGAIEPLYHDNPKHPKQRYRLTEGAKEWKADNQ